MALGLARRHRLLFTASFHFLQFAPVWRGAFAAHRAIVFTNLYAVLQFVCISTS